MNKAREVRQALGLTPKECGQLLCGSSAKTAYNQWTQWESGARNPSGATERLFDVILTLKIAQDLKTPGSDKSLTLVLSMLSD